MKNFISLFAIFFLSTAALAQANKCKIGEKMVIQDKPCKATAPEGPLPNTAEEVEAIEQGKTVCREGAPKLVSWKDPESIRVGNVVPGKVTNTDIDGRKVRARYFSVMINAKNSYGGYTGEKTLGCYASLDGRKILKVSTLLMDSRL
jgi:hypothetical protein